MSPAHAFRDLIEVSFPGEPGLGWVAGIYLCAMTGASEGYHMVAAPDADDPEAWDTYAVTADEIRPAGSVGEA